MDVQPSGPKPDWAPTIDPQMLAVIEQLKATEPPKFPSLSPFQVRNAVLPAEAATALLMKTGIQPMAPKTDIVHKVLPVGSDEGTLVRMYKPLDAGPGPLPIIVYYHGGGWVIADLDTYEPSARALAAKTGAIVASVAYRQAPEHTFPTAHEDAFAAYKWIAQNAAEIGGDPARIATAGESAGGNLAVAVAMMARDRGVRLPNHILSVYPIADHDVASQSYTKYAKAMPLSKPFMEWFFDYYTPDWRDNEEEFVALVDADLSGLPATTIINAEIDPLTSEGEELERKLRAAGVPVERRLYEGVTHEFFGMAALLEQAVDVQDYAAGRLKQGLMAGSAPAEAANSSMGAGSAMGTDMAGITVKSGLRGPESVIFDAEQDIYFVTNVNGEPGERDDNGFISRLKPDGSIAELKWVDGAERDLELHAPKGMALSGKTLYVADITGVHAFDRTTGRHLSTWETPDAQFLNAVSVGADGSVYASDSGIEFGAAGPQAKGTSKIYKWDARGNRSVLVSGEGVKGANGLVAQPDGSVVTASILGKDVISVGRDGRATVLATMPTGGLDGLVRLTDGSHLVTSWEGKAIYHLMADGKVETLYEGIESPADIHVDEGRGRILVPMLMANTVRIVPLKR